MTRLRVCTWNLKFASEDGPHPWSQRRAAMLTVLNAIDADLIATQEGLDQQLRDLDAGLPGYQRVGTGRGGDSEDEHCAIFARAPISITDSRTFWLSPTPDQAGPPAWGSSCPRICTQLNAEVMGQAGTTPLALWNTHLDNRSAEAREHGAQLIAADIARYRANTTTGAVLFTGDCNCRTEASEAPYTILTEQLSDLALEADDTAHLDTNSWHGYQPIRHRGSRIDWILGSGLGAVHHYAHVLSTPDGVLPSDHWPVVAEISLPD
ncbi:MAG: endonuclease/exonuclease/phosphatase family protein [Planctomycetota bacterium]|nr:endonuclease/exonuclease/phosphatase family protein [Planctomycetota bacterium]